MNFKKKQKSETSLGISRENKENRNIFQNKESYH
jgi:hypothetical protein